MVALGGGEVQRLHILDPGTRLGDWSALRPGRALPSEKGTLVAIGEEAGWQPEPVWKDRLEEKSSLASAGDRTSIVRVVQSVVRHYTD
jgi:hypothetical protein